MSVEKGLCFKFNTPLHEQDTEEQTYDCRQNNLDICENNVISGIRDFCSDDRICKKPVRAWKKQYLKLKNEEE